MGILFSRTAADANQANQAAVVGTQANQAGEQTAASVPAGAGAAATTMQPAVATPSAQSTTSSDSCLPNSFTSYLNIGLYCFTLFFRNTWKAIQAFLNIPIQSIGYQGFQICDTCRAADARTIEEAAENTDTPVVQPADTTQAADTIQAVANA